MVCNAEQDKLLKVTGGISGASPFCVATSVAFFLGDLSINCNHETCPLLGISLIPLTQGKYAIVDTEDYEWLMRHKWHTVKSKCTYYAGRNQSYYFNGHKIWRRIHMHRAIMRTPQGKQIDHRNHDGLDNRRCNLRECSHIENMRNQLPQKTGTSRYKGVHWEKERGKWRAQIKHTCKQMRLGRYASEKDAAKAYDKKAKELFGEFAYLNFPRYMGGTHKHRE